MSLIRLATKGCPCTGCTTDKSRIIFWKHLCNNDVFLDNYAKVHCFKCNSNWKILDSRFKCKDCHNYSSPQFTRLGRILAALSTMEFDNVRKEISSFSQKEFSDFLDEVVDNLK